jgi:plasmid maintenance system antidote protein VapI
MTTIRLEEELESVITNAGVMLALQTHEKGQAEVARELGVSRQLVWATQAGTQRMSARLAFRVRRVYGVAGGAE